MVSVHEPSVADDRMRNHQIEHCAGLRHWRLRLPRQPNRICRHQYIHRTKSLSLQGSLANPGLTMVWCYPLRVNWAVKLKLLPSGDDHGRKGRRRRLRTSSIAARVRPNENSDLGRSTDCGMVSLPCRNPSLATQPLSYAMNRVRIPALVLRQKENSVLKVQVIGLAIR